MSCQFIPFESSTYLTFINAESRETWNSSTLNWAFSEMVIFNRSRQLHSWQCKNNNWKVPFQIIYHPYPTRCPPGTLVLEILVGFASPPPSKALLFYRCNCFGHADHCDTSHSPYKCLCSKESYTEGNNVSFIPNICFTSDPNFQNLRFRFRILWEN